MKTVSVERAGIHLSAVAVFGHFKCGVGGVSALRGFQYTFVVVVNDLLGVIHATVGNRADMFAEGRVVPETIVTMSFSMFVGCAGHIC